MDMSSTAAVPVRQIGSKAYDALRRSSGRAEPISSFGESGYRLAGEEIIWVGSRRHALHPRAVLIDDVNVPRGCLELAGCRPWHPAPMPFGAAPSVLRTNGCRLRTMIGRVGVPRGFGALLTGDLPEFPLNFGAPHVHALAAAIAGRDSHRAVTAALPLLGLGPGLTPSGDDLVGAALFGVRRVLREDCAAAWDAAARALAAETRRRSNVISAALFADLVEDRSFARLHRLARALAGSMPDDDAIVAAARDLVAIGHSSGWDMLAGLIIGITGTVGGSPQRERSL